MLRPLGGRRLFAGSILLAVATASGACGAGTPVGFTRAGADSAADSDSGAISAGGPTVTGDFAASRVTSSPAPSDPTITQYAAPETDSTAPAPGDTATASPAPVTATPAPVTDLTPAQTYLLAGVRSDVQASCRPAVELPLGATAGIQCDGSPPIDAVGFFLYSSRRVMRHVFWARLHEHGVTRRTGHQCRDGEPGEAIDRSAPRVLAVRVGCYFEPSGLAGLRILIPSKMRSQNVSIVVTSSGRELAPLLDWLNTTSPGATGCVFCVDLWRNPTRAS